MPRKKGLKMYMPVNLGMFNGYLVFSCGYKISELRDEIKKQGEDNLAIAMVNCEDLSDETAGTAIRKKLLDYTYYLIAVNNRWTGSVNDYVTLSHEIVHICQYVLDRIMDRTQEVECEAYLHSHIMDQILNTIKEMQCTTKS